MLISIGLVLQTLMVWTTSGSTGHAEIGNYPDLLSRCELEENECPLKCGYGREAQVMDDSCFLWHNSDTEAKIMNGRPAMFGEVPYVVYVAMFEEGYFAGACTGSILNERMIVTAAHCVGKNVTYFIAVVGERNATLIEEALSTYQTPDNVYDIDINSIEVHPNFLLEPKEEIFNTREYDIALMFTTRPMILEEYISEPICLPERDIINDDYEYAMISGWGLIGPEPEDSPPDAQFLPLGWVRTEPMMDNETDKSGDLILAKYLPYPNGTTVCAGDSGSPLIQYVNGRAVLIGTVWGDQVYLADVTPCTLNETSLVAWVRVSRKVDWILDSWQKWIEAQTPEEPETEAGKEIPGK